MRKEMTYQEALSYLETLHTFGIKLGLERIRQLLALMGNPQKKYKCVHVTGTNGKGSTTAILAEVLKTAEIRTGMYTSPHLVSYTERMRVNGQNATEREFASSIAYVKTCVDQMVGGGAESPTQFEVLTAAAFYHFSLKNVEYAVIEVGLGGLLDSTNVIVPEVAIITNVAMEHADRCGGTLAGIARHKAGVIKNGCSVVTAANGEALEIICQKAEEKQAALFVLGKEFQASFQAFAGKMQRVSFSAAPAGVSATYTLALLGGNQVENSALAMMAALILANSEKRITSLAIAQGMQTVCWPARFEYFNLKNVDLIIDGAHNPAGARVLKQNLEDYFAGRRRVYLLGILKDKDVDGILEALLRPEDVVVVTRPNSERAALPEEVALRMKKNCAQVEARVSHAFAQAIKLAKESDACLCVCGSLYLVGAVRQMVLELKE